MNKLREVAPAIDSLSNDARWKLALQVAATHEFQKSARLRDFLLYICEKTLSGQLQEVHEQQIGTVVFGRRADYNASEDNIVRVEARELRRRLAVYFASEGKDEPLVITIPKGRYVPLFEPRTSAVPEVTPLPPLATGQAGSQAPEPEKKLDERLPTPSRKTGLAVPLFSGLVILLFLSGVWQWRENQKLKEDLRAALNPSPSPSGIWARLFDSEHDTYIVTADSCFVLIQDITHKEISLKDYISRRHAELLRTPELQIISSRRYTDLADVVVAAKILQATAGFRQRTAVRYARNLEIQDLKTKNLILLGGYRSNPWVEQFAQHRNFLGGLDEQTRRPYYLNKSPHPGEQASYLTRGKDGMWEETHGVITFLPNLSHDGNVLIIEGATAEGTEAAGDFLTDPAFSTRLRQYLNLDEKDQPIPYFELLLKVSSLPGAPTKVEYVTHRILSEQNR